MKNLLKPELELHDAWVRLLGWRLVQHGEAQLQRVVRLHLDEGVYVPHRRDEVRDEGLEFVIQLYFLRHIPDDVVKQLFNVLKIILIIAFFF